MVASLGLGLVLENHGAARLRQYRAQLRDRARAPVSLPRHTHESRADDHDVVAVDCGDAAMYVLLTRMPIGRAMRAVADNPALALVRGIDSPRIIRWTWFIAGMLLAVGGVLIGMDRALEPPMGIELPRRRVRSGDTRRARQSARRVRRARCIIGIVSELSTLVIPPNYRIGIPLCVDRADTHLPAAGALRPGVHPQMISLVDPHVDRRLFLGDSRARAQLPMGPGRHGEFRARRLLRARRVCLRAASC